MKEDKNSINEIKEDPNDDQIYETDPEDLQNEYTKTIEEPEDSNLLLLFDIYIDDGENRYVPNNEKLSMTSSITTLSKCMIGCGILNMPFCFKTLGIFGGLLCACIAVSISICSVYFLMKCKQITQRYGYSMYAKICIGSFGTFIIKFSVVAMTFGINCVYLKIFGGIFQSLVELFVTTNDSFYYRPIFYYLIIFFILMPLMFKDDITGLKKFSFIGNVSIGIFLVSIIIIFIFKYFNEEIEPYDSSMLYPHGDFIQLFVAATSLIDSFSFQMNTFPVYLAMKNRTSGKLIKAVAISAMFTGILYSLTGVIGYFMYRAKLQNVVIEYLTLDINIYKETHIYIAGVLFICAISFYISAMLTMPLQFFVLKKNLITLIGFLKKKVFKRTTNNNDNEKTLAISMATTRVIMESVDQKTKVIITLLAYIGILICTISVESIFVITNIVGATVANVVNMLGPALFIFILSQASFCSCEKILSKIYFSLGSSIMILFAYTKIKPFF